MEYVQTSFLDQLQDTLTRSSSNFSVTENGAIGFKTTGRKLMDLNFAVSSLRSKTDSEVEHAFAMACGEGVELATVWLFFARDVRGGLGERRLFRIGIKYLARNFPQLVRRVLPLISEYGRWDDLVCLMGTAVHSDVVDIIRDQLVEDMENLEKGQSISLLAKWLPSENTSSAETRKRALDLIAALKVTPRSYRLMLTSLRKKIGVIERLMSQNQWSSIDYQGVPSRANLLYNSAFLRHDETRRREYLGKLEKGETKINASTLFPHDIVHSYAEQGGWWSYSFAKQVDPAKEAMWKSLPNTVKDGGSTIVVADGSGSMCSAVGNTGVKALEVANALAIYFAEKLSGPYKDRYITFSHEPQLVNLSGATTLLDKLKIAQKHNEVANTNIEAVFDLILETAVNNHLTQQDIPANILIISDMEFDRCATSHVGGCTSSLFNQIAEKYCRHGYQLPRLVFWNVNSRTGTIPVVENDLGVALVSGFSPSVAKMVMSNQTDPMAALLDILASERYKPVVDALVA